jgi:hypothetical protein
MRTGLWCSVAAGVVVALAGCASPTEGHAVSAATVSASSPTNTTTSTRPVTLTANLCALLDWPDLGYPGTENANGKGPNATGVFPDWKQSCKFSSMQFFAGYTPPPRPECNDRKGAGMTSDVECMSEDTRQLSEIYKNSTWVTVIIAFREGEPVVKPTSYVEAGHTVYMSSDDSKCLAGTQWAGGVLGIFVTDETKAFRSPCDEAKKVMATLIQREPR